MINRIGPRATVDAYAIIPFKYFLCSTHCHCGFTPRDVPGSRKPETPRAVGRVAPPSPLTSSIGSVAGSWLQF
jgi:hypothetical protein